MNHELEVKIEKYIKEINRLIVSSRKEKKRFLQTLRTEIENYVSDNPDADMDDIITAFGAPDQFAAEFLDSADHKKIKESVSIKKLLLGAVGIVLVVLTLFLIMGLIDGRANSRGFYMVCLEDEEGNTIVSERVERI